MFLFLYNLLLSLYGAVIRVYALLNDKAKKWVAGRKHWERQISSSLRKGDKRIWVHCSSVGEFEQARPVISALRRQYPQYRIVVTFFSPSGYEANKNNSQIDHIFYLPMDSRRNARRFIDLVAPSLVIFIKYEFWYHYLCRLRDEQIPVILVSGAFRKGQAFFKWHGGLFRKMLGNFTFFFLQDEESRQLLNNIRITNALVAGDTRYDRVSSIAADFTPVDAIEKFKGAHRIFIAGSTWPGDEQVLQDCIPLLPAEWKMIIAPHEIDAAHISRLRKSPGYESSVLFSELTTDNDGHNSRILIIDNIGMLSRLYAYGDVAFVGGGFQKEGIHNILEPAVFGVPVLFGPVYQKFVEARTLASLHYVFPVNDAAEAKLALMKLITGDEFRIAVGQNLKLFMREHIGATESVMAHISKEGWLR